MLEICTEGEIAGYDTRILELAVLKGFFGAISDEPVTYVNAPQLAKEHGVEVREVQLRDVGRTTSTCSRSAAAATRSAARWSGRAASSASSNIDDTPFDVPPADHMVVVTNDDRPGVIGTVGTLLGDAGVNIADMDVSRVDGSGTAAMLIAPTAPVVRRGPRRPPRRPRHPQRHPSRLTHPLLDRVWERSRARAPPNRSSSAEFEVGVGWGGPSGVDRAAPAMT